MAQPKKAKKPEKTEKANGTKLIFAPPADRPSDEEDDEEMGGMFLEKEDIQILYKALRAYKPTADEEQRYELLLEEFDMILVVDYDETPSGMN